MSKAKWTEKILDETFGGILERRPDVAPDRASPPLRPRRMRPNGYKVGTTPATPWNHEPVKHRFNV